jgi:steroid delta-isomerase-like uncharacterized protein
MTQETQEAEQLARDYAELWNEQDYSRIPDVVSESFVHVSPGAPDGEARGHDGLEEFMRQITASFPDFEVEIIDMLADEGTVMSENIFTMTHEGEYEGVPPTGQEVEVGSMAKLSVDDGKLQEVREYVNEQEIYEQLGVAVE